MHALHAIRLVKRGLHAVHAAEMVVHARDLVKNCHTLQTGVVLRREKGEWPKFHEGRENSEISKGEKEEKIMKGEGKIFRSS